MIASRLADPFLKFMLSQPRVRALLQAGRSRFDSMRHCWKYGAPYYTPRYRLGPQILRTRFPTHPDAQIELHMLLCGRDFLMGLWALASWMVHSGIPTRIFIHDDGTLNRHHALTLQQVFPGSSFVSLRKADELAHYQLGDFPNCSRMRKLSTTGLKLVDFRLLSKGPVVLSLDSDVFFFDRPAEIIQRLQNWSAQPPFVFMKDVVPSYSLAEEAMGQEAGRTVPLINTGLALIRPDSVDYFYLEELCGRRPEIFSDPFLAEQTAYAILACKNGFDLLSHEYRIPSAAHHAPLVAGHYVRGIRERFWIDAVGTGHYAILGRMNPA
jgi:hypothetical protein